MPKTFASLRPIVTADGQRLDEQRHAALRSVRVSKGLGTPAYARLAFTVSVDAPDIGIALGKELKLGVDGLKDAQSHDVVWDLFDGVVVSLGIELDTGYTQTFVVEAYDKLYELGRQSVAKTYLQSSPSDIIRELVRSAGLRAEIGGSFGSQVRASSYQYGTAYAYIDRLVRDEGCEWFVDRQTLHVRPRANGTGTPVTLTVGQNLLDFSARFSATDHVDKVTVTGWDVANKQPIVGSATSSGSLAGSSIGTLTVSAVKRSGVGGTTALSIPRPVADQAEAERLAKGIVQRRESDMLRARGRIIPDDQVVPGAMLKLEGLVGTWDGTYYCTEVEHVWGTSSFDTYFEVGSTEPDSLLDLFGGSSTPTLDRMLGGLTIGLVTDNKDPDAMNRVKLKLPYLADDQQTGWARVVQPGAGKGRGWNVLPEIEDEVLVGFEHGDIDRPYVLGGLVNGKDKPPYLGADDDLLSGGKVVARTFTSSVGHEIFVADGATNAKKYIQMNTAGKEAILFVGAERIDLQAKGVPVKVFNEKGSVLIADNGDITLQSQGNITIKAAKDVTIEGMNVNIKGRTAAKVEGGAELGLKGGASATLEASGATTVKGSIVKIN